MARYIEGEHGREQSAKEVKMEKEEDETKVRFGVHLGKAFFNYTHDYQGSSETRLSFAEEVVTVLENGSHEEKLAALAALLEAFEAKLLPVQIKADDALWRHMPIG
ncbi:MAG: hypothetical protein Q7R43_04475 [Candidatus Daviesbacteria bacterium]|nr:hypothetical protein [Candidatus Daviesbacteria bacterium]